MTGSRPAALTVLAATSNRGKLAEIRAILGDLPIEIVEWSAVTRNHPQVVEDGATFDQNALLKARTAAKDTLLITLADDSGLEVDALGGRPGVRSARFARDGATDAENNAALLTALEEIEDDQRTASFRCVVCLYDPWNEIEPATTAEGRCAGAIARQTRGGGGFGYDPLFVVDGFGGRTMAELSADDKNRVSHRAHALTAMRPRLAALVEERVATSLRLCGAGFAHSPAPR